MFSFIWTFHLNPLGFKAKCGALHQKQPYFLSPDSIINYFDILWCVDHKLSAELTKEDSQNIWMMEKCINSQVYHLKTNVYSDICILLQEYVYILQECKILQARLQQYMNRELPGVQAGFRKGKGIKLSTSAGLLKKQESSRKTSISALLTVPKPLTVWITINCGKFWKRWEY